MQADNEFNKAEKEQHALNDHFRDLEIPVSAEKRYARLKEHLGEWHFIDFRNRFLSNSLSAKDIPTIMGAIQQIEAIRNHELLQQKESKSKLFKEAKAHVIAKSLDTIQDEEKLLLLMFTLHENDWFNLYPVPDEAFEFNTAKRWDMIGEVYGKYFKFYDYLRDLLEKIEPRLLDSGSKKPTDILKTKKTISSFRDIFHDEDKFEKMMKRLSEKMPVVKGFDATGDAVVSRRSGDQYSWNNSIKPAKSYIAGILQYCGTKYWIGTFTMEEYTIALSKTFGVAFKSDTLIKKAISAELDSKYTAPFSQLLEGI